MSIETLKIYNQLYTNTERKQLIADMITEFRKLYKYQKKEVAELIGIKPQTYGAYESGRNEIPAEILVRLSILYDTPTDVLMQRDVMTKNEETAKSQLDRYDEEISKLREEVLKGKPEATELITQMLQGIQELNDNLKKNIEAGKK